MHNADSPEQLHLVDQPPDKHKIKIGTGPTAFQARVGEWMQTCFGAEISADRTERNHRFLEEALELAQANHCTESEAHQLVDYVFGRPVGNPIQEVGGTLLTLAALCSASYIDMALAGETELARVWTKVEQIRAKNAAKPKHSPLPGPSTPAKATAIQLTPAEVQSGYDRVRWAEGLIRQLPEDHDGRNSWLLNYGGKSE